MNPKPFKFEVGEKATCHIDCKLQECRGKRVKIKDRRRVLTGCQSGILYRVGDSWLDQGWFGDECLYQKKPF